MCPSELGLRSNRRSISPVSVLPPVFAGRVAASPLLWKERFSGKPNWQPRLVDPTACRADTMSAEASITYSSGRATSVPGEASSPPDLRILHYNDVYHLDPSSSEPSGGAARFVAVCKEYREGDHFKGQPELVTLFSGDVFNPSLESSVTKGMLRQRSLCISSNAVQVVTWLPSSTKSRPTVPALALVTSSCPTQGMLQGIANTCTPESRSRLWCGTVPPSDLQVQFPLVAG